jgi:hypothetical protein
MFFPIFAFQIYNKNDMLGEKMKFSREVREDRNKKLIGLIGLIELD